jgi:serine/threonine protein kinase
MVETMTLAGKLQEPQPNGPKSMKFTFQPESKPLDGYTIKRAIHRGGFGEVYYALTDAGKEVALKLLKQHFDVELRGVSQCLNLKHPNLVTIFDVKTDADGDHWVIMEFVAGKSLAQVLDEYPDGMPIEDVTKWLAGMVEGLNFLHDRGIVHRDLKPGNVFLESGVVKIGDVGLSKFISESHRSAQTQSVGTVYYMAPEVAHGRYGREVDIYSLGVVLYELLTGRVPFVGESAGEILMKHLSERPDLSPIPRRFRPILASALEKDPLRRTPTVRQLLEDFKRAAVGYEVPQPIPDDSFIHQTVADSSTVDRERGQERAHAATINFPQMNTPVGAASPGQTPRSANLKDIFANDVARAIQVAEEAARRAGEIADRAYKKSYNRRFASKARKREERWARKARRWREQYPTFWGWHARKKWNQAGVHPAAYAQPAPQGSPADPRAQSPPKEKEWSSIFKLLIVGLAILALMPRPFSNATLEVVSAYVILGLVLYFLYKCGLFFAPGLRKGSAVPPANQTNAGNSSPPGAAPAAAAYPGPNAGPGVVPVRLVRSPGGRRWSVLDPDTLREIPLRQRTSELMLSLTYAALTTGLIVAGLSWATGLFSDWSQVGQFAGTLLAGSWLILTQAKFMEGTRMDAATRRVALVLSGLAIGGVSLWLNQTLVATLPTADQFHAAHVAIDHIGPNQLVEAGTKGQPSNLGYMVFFSGLLALPRWWRQADSFRRKRLAIWSIIPSALVGLALTMLFPFPTVWGMIWAAALSMTVQLSASWCSPSERVALMEAANHAA